MRTALAIDDDVLAAAQQLADREPMSVGDALSALARQGMARGIQASRTVRNGIPLLPNRKGAVAMTPELVNQPRDDLPRGLCRCPTCWT